MQHHVFTYKVVTVVRIARRTGEIGFGLRHEHRIQIVAKRCFERREPTEMVDPSCVPHQIAVTNSCAFREQTRCCLYRMAQTDYLHRRSAHRGEAHHAHRIGVIEDDCIGA